MTTNKPEVLGYCVKRDRGRWKRSNNYYLSPNPDENYTVPVIPLSDYEALQSECERLRKDAERYRRLRRGDIDNLAVVRGLGAMDYGMSAVIDTYSEEIDGDALDAAVDAALATGGKE